MKVWLPVFLCGACLLPASAASGRPAQLTWDALAAQADTGCSIRMALPDGAVIEGHPLGFRPEAMDLRVYKTSDRRAHPKGRITIPRASVAVVEVRARRWKGRLIGVLVPIGAGAAMVGGAIAGAAEGALYGLLAGGGLTIGLGGPAGYFIGRAFDRRFEQFSIVPEGKLPDNAQ